MYILIGNQFDTYLNGWFPLIIFYVCNLTGTFLFDSFDQKEPLQLIFPNFLLLACIGSLMGSFAFITPLLLDFSGILLGLSCSVLLPMYTTLMYHEQKIYNHKLSTKDNMLALISIFLFTPCVLFSIKFIRPELGFLLYGIGFFYCYLTMQEFPDYKLKNSVSTKFNSKIFFLFILLAGLTFAAKGLRVLTNSHLLTVLIVLITMLFLGCFYFIKSNSNSLNLTNYFYLFSFLQGALTNFMILFGTFSLFVLDHSTNQLYLELYVPYGVGVLTSLFCGNLVIKQFKSFNPIIISNIALILCVPLMLLSFTFPLAAFLIGFFGSINGRLLNKMSYNCTKEMPDRSLLYKNEWNKLGSIAQQSLLFLILAGISFINKFSFSYSLATITGRTEIVSSVKLGIIVQVSGSIICCILCTVYSISLYKYKNKTTQN